MTLTSLDYPVNLKPIMIVFQSNWAYEFDEPRKPNPLLPEYVVMNPKPETIPTKQVPQALLKPTNNLLILSMQAELTKKKSHQLQTNFIKQK